MRYAPSATQAELRRLLTRAALATLALTGAVALGLLLVAKLGVPELAPLGEPVFALGFVALALGTSLAWVLDAYYIAEQRAMLVLLRNVAFNLVKLVIPLVLAFDLAGRAVPLAWAVGLAASLAVAFALLPRALARHAPHGERPARGATGYAMRNYALNLSEFLPGLVLPIVVLHMLGAEENARFFLGWTIAMVGFLASKAIAQSAFAALVRADDERPALRKAIVLSAGLVVPPAIVLYVAAPSILSLFGAHYVGGAALLRLLALSIPFVIASNLYLAHLKARDASWELTLLPLASLVARSPSCPSPSRPGGSKASGSPGSPCSRSSARTRARVSREAPEEPTCPTQNRCPSSSSRRMKRPTSRSASTRCSASFAKATRSSS